MAENESDVMGNLVSELKKIFAADLVCVALFGSAAENRLRLVSDTNMIVVVDALIPEQAATARKVISLAHIALRLRLMVLRKDEIGKVASAFAVKFADIQRRHRILYGSNPFKDVLIPRSSAIAQLNQSLLNLILRMREQWLLARDDRQLGISAASMAGGLRSCAAELLALEGVQGLSPKSALEKIAGSSLPDLSDAREGKVQEGSGNRLLEQLLHLATQMEQRADLLT